MSSIDIENVATAHPAVAMAACIGARHPKWDERPIIIVVKRPNTEVTREELLAFYKDKVAKWQIPDDVIFMESIPIGATGKIQKNRLREMLKDYVLPSLVQAQTGGGAEEPQQQQQQQQTKPAVEGSALPQQQQ